MSRACSTSGDEGNSYRIFVEKPEGKRPLGPPRCRCVNSIKWDGMVWLGIGSSGWIFRTQQ
jgi:hypothetical protein